MYSAIFWDNDGILMETEHLYYLANAEALARVGVELPLETFRRVSLQQGESVLKLAADRGDDVEVRRWRDARYLDLLATESKVIPGVRNTLARLHGRLPMAVVTSCRREHFQQMHQRSGLLDYFDFILTREDYGNSKPDPEPYLTACARAGLPPAACLAVEDSVRGVTAAATAGLAVAAIPGAMNHGGDFSAARWRLDSVHQIPELLGIGLDGCID